MSSKGPNKSFVKVKKFKKGTKRHELHKLAKNTLGAGNLRSAVRLPPHETLNEWLAVNVVDFFNQINMLYQSVSLFCSNESCPIMNAGPKFQYFWSDGVKIKKPVKCSAPDYIKLLMEWVQTQLDDEVLFPTRVDVPFPRGFIFEIKVIFRRLFRVYAHIYWCHFHNITSLSMDAHFNTCFKHFYYFIDEFNLVDKKELEPLEHVISNLVG
jgi:MOB kinase activator 1